ncbi:MAG TPA: hypothetical protein VF705_08885, partial [Longimicrobium sp.]
MAAQATETETLALADPLGGTGEPRAVPGDRPLPLERGRAWIVASGRVDVFAVELVDGEPVGRRTHLFRAEAGDPLVGAGAGAGLMLVGVGSTGTRVAELYPEVMRGAEPEAWPRMAGLLHSWIE